MVFIYTTGYIAEVSACSKLSVCLKVLVGRPVATLNLTTNFTVKVPHPRRATSKGGSDTLTVGGLKVSCSWKSMCCISAERSAVAQEGAGRIYIHQRCALSSAATIS